MPSYLQDASVHEPPILQRHEGVCLICHKQALYLYDFMGFGDHKVPQSMVAGIGSAPGHTLENAERIVWA